MIDASRKTSPRCRSEKSMFTSPFCGRRGELVLAESDVRAIVLPLPVRGELVAEVFPAVLVDPPEGLQHGHGVVVVYLDHYVPSGLVLVQDLASRPLPAFPDRFAVQDVPIA